jgi:two-component system sensor histidine kinase MtrB
MSPSNPTLPSPTRTWPGGRTSWWAIPVSWWWRSLPLRVIASVFLASVLVLVLGGFLLMQQATLGVMEGKKESVRNESRQALSAAQQQLNAADPTGGANVDKLLTDLAFGYANRTGGTDQFEVIIVAAGQTITAGRADVASVPDSLRQQVSASTDLLMTPTQVVYRDGAPSVPGLVTGSQLTLPGAGTYEIYFVFPLTQEVDTLRFLRSAAGTTGAILVILLTFIAALVARQVVTPVRAARRAAESLASGNLDDRMQVKGQDDLARLAASMNYMASELQKQITQLEDLSKIQQRFVSDVSHELRTPLTTVRMAAEVLYEARDEFDPVSARSAELLQNELDRFEALLGDLLEISRFDAGAVVLTTSNVDLVELVQRVVDDHAQFAQRAGCEIVVRAPGPCTAEVDARRIERIVRNLLVNAIEHSEAKPIDVLIDADDDAVAIAVRDHGVGFEASQARQVFHRFWRADPARARTMGGTGLGLAIAMEDANLHNGWLTAWGRPGLGAQFRLTVPRKSGGILLQSPLPLVPRDIVGLNVRLGGTESPLNGPGGAVGPSAPPTPSTSSSPSPVTSAAANGVADPGIGTTHHDGGPVAEQETSTAIAPGGSAPARPPSSTGGSR